MSPKLRAALRLAHMTTAALGALGPVVLKSCVEPETAPGPEQLQGFAKKFTDILGIKVNVKGGEMARGDENTSVVTCANHQSWLDVPIVMGLARGTLAGAGHIGDNEFFGPIARAMNMLFVNRPGQDFIVFPEAATPDGTRIPPVSHGVADFPFNGAALEAEAERRVILQPLYIRVAKIDGEHVGDDQALRDRFAWHGGTPFRQHLRRVLETESMEVEVDVLRPIRLADCRDGGEARSDLRGAFLRARQTANSVAGFMGTLRKVERAYDAVQAGALGRHGVRYNRPD